MHTSTDRLCRLLILFAAAAPLSCTKSSNIIEQPLFPTATQPSEFAEEDRAVIEAVLISLITDPDFRPDGATKGSFDSIVLLDRSQRSFGYPMKDLKRCPPTNGLTPEAMFAYQQRNSAARDLPDTGWDPRIRILNESQLPRDQFVRMPDGQAFRAKYPLTKGWLSIGLPCYLADGSHAYVEIGYKWCAAHSASGEFLLDKVHGKWRVQRRSFKLYA